MIEQLGVNAVDIGIAVVLLLSAIMGFFRGFVHEVFSVGGWVGATAAAVYGFPYAQPHVQEFISVEWIANAVAGAGLFIVTLLLLALVTGFVTSLIKDSALSPLDNSLGFLFGLARGALLICLVYIGLTWMVLDEDEDPPSWLAEARSHNLMALGSDWLMSLVPEETYRAAREKAVGAERDAQKMIEDKTQEQLNQMLTLPPKGGESPPPGGYEPGARQDMDRLYEGVQ